MEPHRWAAQDGLERGSIEVAGVQRTFWLARAPEPGQRAGRRERSHAPLLIVLHGSGMDGRNMARFTGLAKRGPAAGITTVFPDGWKGGWHTVRAPDREPHLDDTLFLGALSSHLEVVGAAQAWPVFLAGVSSGAWFAEHVARHGLLPVAGLFLVAGTALEVSRRVAPVPLLHTPTTLIMGTGDRAVPYQGGRLSRRGLSGLLLRRRGWRHGELPGEDVVAGAEAIAADWAKGNGIGTGPSIEELPHDPSDPADLPVTRMAWSAPGCHPVTLYRIDGGGHGWPGSPELLPARVAGPITKTLDATGILLDMAESDEHVTAVGRTLGAGS